jgi:hypothetical protein
MVPGDRCEPVIRERIGMCTAFVGYGPADEGLTEGYGEIVRAEKAEQPILRLQSAGRGFYWPDELVNGDVASARWRGELIFARLRTAGGWGAAAPDRIGPAPVNVPDLGHACVEGAGRLKRGAQPIRAGAVLSEIAGDGADVGVAAVVSGLLGIVAEPHRTAVVGGTVASIAPGGG